MRLITLLVDIHLGSADVRLSHGAVAASKIVILCDVGMARLTLGSVVTAIRCQNVLLLLQFVMDCPFLDRIVVIAHGVLAYALLKRRLIALALSVDFRAVRVRSPLLGAIEGVSQIDKPTIRGLLLFLLLLFTVAI